MGSKLTLSGSGSTANGTCYRRGTESRVVMRKLFLYPCNWQYIVLTDFNALNDIWVGGCCVSVAVEFVRFLLKIVHELQVCK